MVALPVPDDKKTLSLHHNIVVCNGACLFGAVGLPCFGASAMEGGFH